MEFTHVAFPTQPAGSAPATAVPDATAAWPGTSIKRNQTRGWRAAFALLGVALLVIAGIVAYSTIDRTPEPTQERTLLPSQLSTSSTTNDAESWPPRRFVIDHPDFLKTFPDGIDLDTNVIRVKTTAGHHVVRKCVSEPTGQLTMYTFLFFPHASHYFVEHQGYGIYHPYDPTGNVMFVPYHLEDDDQLEASRDSHTSASVRGIIKHAEIRDLPTVRLTDATKQRLGAHDPHTCRVELQQWIAQQHEMVEAWQRIQNRGLVRTYVRNVTLTNIDISADGQRLLFNEAPPKLLDLVTGQATITFPGDVARPESIQFSHDNTKVLIAQHGNLAGLFDGETGKPIRYFQGHERSLWNARFSSDDRLIVTASMDETIRIWETESGDEVACLEGHEGEVRDAVFSPDGETLASCGEDGIVRLWSIDEQTEVARFAEQPMKVTCVAFTPRGDRLITTCDDGVVRVCDVQTHKEVFALTGHLGWALRVIVSRDGKRAVSCGWDCTIRVWDLETGQQLHRLAGHSSQVWSVIFSPDESFLYSASTDGTIRKWKMPE